MSEQPNRYDPRFYFIRVNSLTLFSPPTHDILLKFRLGTKTSESRYSSDMVEREGGFSVREEELEREVHVLKYGAEEFLNVFVRTGSDSYARILLPPLIERPHTRHNLTVTFFQNIFSGEGGEEEVRAAGEVNLDLYFQFNFSGSLEVIPVAAHLERDLAEVGEMRPRVRLELEETSWSSLAAEGGIHPHWSGHFHANRAQQGLIESIEQNLRDNKLDQWARLLKMASNSLGLTREDSAHPESNAPYFDCTEFPMRSAGSYLKVEIISDPLIGSKPDVIGSATIRVEDEGLLKFPRRPEEKLFEEKLIKLYHLDEVTGEKVPAGVLKLYFRFVFDKQRVLRKNTTFPLL